jgi:hypothetical protein
MNFLSFFDGQFTEGTLLFFLAWWNCYLFGMGNMLALTASPAGIKGALGQNMWEWIRFPLEP